MSAPERPKPRARDPFRLASWLSMLVLVPLCARLAYDVGIVWDEEASAHYGDKVLAWFRSGFTDEGALSYSDLYLYGALFELPVQWFLSEVTLPWGPFETRHMISAVIAALGVLATGKAAAAIAGPRAGFLAGTVLALTPCWIGHGMFNPKDIPFGAAAAFVSYATVRIALRPAPLTWRDALIAGMSVGLALGVRAGGMFLLLYPGATALARFAFDAKRIAVAGGARAIGRNVAALVARLGAALALAWALMVCTWPWALKAPIDRPLEAAEIAKRFVWNGATLFDGAYVPSTAVPDRYLITWFAITLPEIYAFAIASALIAAGAVFLQRKRAGLDWPKLMAAGTLLGAVVAPMIAVLIVEPVNFDAQRHFLFILPPLAASAGLALDWAWRELAFVRGVRLAGAGLFAVLCGIVIYDMAHLHPYQYIYFNRTFGGLAAAYERYETDYWGASYREGIAWVAQNLRRPSGKLLVAACDAAPRTRYYVERWPEARARIEVVDSLDQADVTLAYTRGDCEVRSGGKTLHVVEREGVPLLYVYARKPQHVQLASAH